MATQIHGKIRDRLIILLENFWRMARTGYSVPFRKILGKPRAMVGSANVSNITRRFLAKTNAYLPISGKYIGQNEVRSSIKNNAL